jgi:hypothetical protein
LRSEGGGRTVTDRRTRARSSSQDTGSESKLISPARVGKETTRAGRRTDKRQAGGKRRIGAKEKPAVKKPGVKKPAVKKPAVKKPAVKKPAAKKPAKKPGAKAGGKKNQPSKKSAEKKRRSRSKSAIEARRRRAEQRWIADQLRYERGEIVGRKRRSRRLDEARASGQVPRRWDRMSEAMDWLEDIRNRISSVFPCTLQLADPVTGDAPAPPEEEGMEGMDEEVAMLAERQRENVRTPWLIVGRFDAMVPIGYEDLGEAFLRVEHDLVIEAEIGGARLSQIRIVYSDPRSRRGEGDSIVSEMGAWEYVISAIRQDLIGVVPDDAEALSHRYEETKVPTFYIYFSDEIRGMRSAWSEGWGIE